LGFAAGGLAALPFLAESLEWLAWVSVVPLLLLLGSGRARGVRFCYVVGIGFVAIGTFWLWKLSGLLALLVALSFGLYFAPLAAVPWVRRRAPTLPMWVYVPAVWTFLESLRYTVSVLPTTWLNLGYTQAQVLPLVQLAEWTGVAGVTLLLALANSAMADMVLAFVWTRGHADPSVLHSSRLWAVTGALVAVSLTAGAIWLGSARLRSVEASLLDGPRVLLVQGNLSPSDRVGDETRAQVIGKQVRLTRDGLVPGVDLIAWAETMPLTPELDETRRAELSEIVRALKLPLVTGGIGVARHQGVRLPANSAFLVSPDGEIRGRYDKQVLLPFGEYIPILGGFEWFRKATGAAIARSTGFYPFLRPGHEDTLFELEHRGKRLRFATPICYEDVLPASLARPTRRGADFFLVLSNENFYQVRQMEQHVDMAVFRAIETRRPVLRATHTGRTCAIDPTGRVTARLDRDVEGTLLATVRLSSLAAPGHGGEEILRWTCGLAVAVLGVALRLRHRVPRVA